MAFIVSHRQRSWNVRGHCVTVIYIGLHLISCSPSQIGSHSVHLKYVWRCVEFFGLEMAQRHFVSVLSQICSFCLFFLFPKLITELKPLDEKLKSEEKLLLTQTQIPEQNGKILCDGFICAIYVATLSSCCWCCFVFCGMKQWQLAFSTQLLQPWALVIWGYNLNCNLQSSKSGNLVLFLNTRKFPVFILFIFD